MNDGIFIEGTRTGYAPDQVEDMTVTVGELISSLEEMATAYGDDTPIFLINDNGYTYGEIRWDSISYGQYNKDGEVDLEY